MKLIVTLIFLFKSVFLFSQVNMIWEKEVGGGEDDWGYGICLSDDGMYVFTGVTSSYDEEVPDSIGGTDIWVAKMSPDSNMIWSFTYGGTLNDRGNDVQATSDGGFIITGFSESNDVHITSNNGSKDLFVIKIDATGHLVWSRSFGGTSDEIGNTVLPLPNGEILVAGTAFSSDGDINLNQGFSDYWIIKLDSDGNLIWEKTYGGSGEDRAKKIIQTQDGNFVSLGTSFSDDGDVGNNLGGVDFWLIKIDGNGNLIWEQNYGGGSADQGSDLIETLSGDLIITGEVLSNNGDVVGNHGLTDAWIAKLDSNGNLIWQNSLGGNKVDYFLSIKETDDGGYIATGNTFSDNGDVSINLGASDVWMVKLDINGNLEWEKTIGYDLNEIGNDLITVGDEIIVVGGIQVDHLRHGNSDLYIFKLRAPLTSIIPIQHDMSLKIYPNPSTHFIQLSNDSNIISYQILDIQGRIIQSQFINSNQLEIDVRNIPFGEYFIIVSLESGIDISVPIIIAK